MQAKQAVKLNMARKNKKDEFYTQLQDIENELFYYKDSLKNKTIYCNCDDHRYSNFVKYFIENFKALKIKKLIATSYSNKSKGRFLIYDGDASHTGFLKGDGDFRSEECIGFLNMSDIVITNPPFSLMREYLKQLIEHNKNFLIISHQNIFTVRNIFDYYILGKFWLGYGFKGMATHFINKDYENYATGGAKIDGMIRVSGVIWITNMENGKVNEFLKLKNSYKEGSFLKYNNCDAINVDKVKDIPNDYFGLIGVPITYILKHNPKQFEIIRLRKGDDGEDLVVGGRRPYNRILIRRVTLNPNKVI